MQTLDSLDTFAAHLVSCNRPGDAMVLRSYINELRPYFEPDASPFDPSASQQIKAWAAICEVMREIGGPNWSSAAICARDAAVAAIRSMAAQCSAQPAPAGGPQGVPEPVQGLSSLYYATGYMEGCGRPDVASDLKRIGEWLRTNAPQE